MASIIRVGFGRTFNSIAPAGCWGSTVTVRPITSKAVRCKLASEAPHKPSPWPYHSKRFNLFHYFYDSTSKRFDENTKLIVVEGLIAAGKSQLAKQIAEEFDMLYLPEANLDMYYYNSVGFDLRTLDDQLPAAYQSFDVNNFLVTPKHMQSAIFQLNQYCVKYAQYIDALAHIFSTGQGVVLDRCVYSDFVFAEAMYSQGYMSKAAKKAYYDMRKNSISELLRPHLVLYLDVPVKKVMELVQKRNVSFEKNSQALTPSYLDAMERHYKQSYLKEISKHAELLIYDWTEMGDAEVVLEDIERVDFNKYDKHDEHSKDWEFELEEDYAIARNLYSDNKEWLQTLLRVPHFEVPELVADAEDAEMFHAVMRNTPGERFLKGYDTTLGDKGVMFKIHYPHRFPTPLRERRHQFGERKA